MDTSTLILDEQYSPELEVDLDRIGIRVVVFSKKAGASRSEVEQPLDLEADEDFSASESEVNSYLEFPKRGKLCCVFLINGQRHHGLDNTFIVNDLKMKYLRKRMIIVVDLDGLSGRASAAMLGACSPFSQSLIFKKVREKLVSTLTNDPHLNELASELDDEVRRLKIANPAIQAMFKNLVRDNPTRPAKQAA